MSTQSPAAAATQREPFGIDAMSRVQRRFVVALALVAYPVFVAAWLGLPAIGIEVIPWAVVVAVLGLGTVLSGFLVYAYRRRLAQSPDGDLDERQVAVRDRAYLESYRVFVAVVLVGLLVVGIGSDVVDRPLLVDFDVVQPVLWAGILYGMLLPSAVVAWGEPDLDEA